MLQSEVKPFPQQERKHAHPIKGKKFLTIQDNLDSFNDNVDYGPILLPHSDYFVPADIIDINFPIFGVFSNPAKLSDDPIANILYADLIIKKITEDYAKLRERARKFLQNNHSSISSGRMLFSENLSIHQELSNISTRLSIADATGVTSTIKHELAPAFAPKNNNTILSLHHLHKETAAPTNTKYSDISMSKQTTGRMSTGTKLTHLKQGKPSPSNDQQNSSYSQGIKIVWILELPSIIFHYFLKNKIETIIIGFLLIMVLSFILRLP